MKKLLTLAVLTVGTSFGSVIAMTTTGSSGVDSDAYTVGWAFSISTTISVSALGYYDAGANGLSSSHTVGIYTSTGTLLRSTTVPSGTTGTLTNNYRMTSVTPLILGPGNYVVAGFSNSANDALPFGATMTSATGITLGAKDLYVYGAALAFPTLNANNGTTYGAANFVFTEIPEPSTLLLSFSAFAAVGLKKRLSKRS